MTLNGNEDDRNWYQKAQEKWEKEQYGQKRTILILKVYKMPLN